MSDKDQEHREVPAELLTHGPSEVTPTPVSVSGANVEVAPEDMAAVNNAPYSGKGISPFTPNKTGLTTAGIVAPAVLGGQELIKGGKFIYDRLGPPSLQTYANSQIGDRYNIPLSDLEKEVGFKLQTPKEVQRAANMIAGSPGELARLEPVYQLVNGVPTVVSYTHIPATPPTPGIDVSKYKKTPTYHLKKHAELPARAGIAAYDIGRAFSPNEDPFARAVDVAGGTSMAASHFLPKKVGKVPVKAIATGLGVLPAAMGAVEATQKAEGGLAHLAGGGQPEFGEARAYEPSYNERIGDYVAPYIGRQQADAIFGGPRAGIEDKLNPLAWMAQIPGNVAQSGKDVYESAREGDYLGGMGNYLLGAMDVAPMMSKGKRLAQMLQLQGFNAGTDVGMPAIEKGAKAVAPYTAKAIKALKKFLPKGEYESALAESKLPHYDVGSRVVKGAIKSAKQMAREAEYVHDIEPLHKFSTPKKLSIQDLQGSVLVGVPGDRSLTGQLVKSVNQVPLSKPVEQHGGPLYGLRQLDLGNKNFWASQQGAASALQNKVARAAEEYDKPVFGIYSAMAPDASNYALHHTETLLNQLDALNPSKANINAFNKLIRAEHPSFFGLRDPDVMAQLSMDPEMRKLVADRLNKSTIASKYGLPSGEATLHAITEPALRDVPTGHTGFAVGRLDPHAKLSLDLLGEHPTYNTKIPGEFSGQMIAQLPWQEYFPDVARKIAANPKQAPHAWGTFKMGDFNQPVTQQMVDRIAPLEELALKGQKKGGKVKKKK